MILLTRRDGSQFYINPELIETVEETPDTVITLVNNKKIIVTDSALDVRERFMEYKRTIMNPFKKELKERK